MVKTGRFCWFLDLHLRWLSRLLCFLSEELSACGGLPLDDGELEDSEPDMVNEETEVNLEAVRIDEDGLGKMKGAIGGEREGTSVLERGIKCQGLGSK